MSLEILLGPMFAGKSSAILRTVNRYKSLGWPICSITHSSDSRYSDDARLSNHDLASIPCVKWSSLLDHLDHPCFTSARLVIVDEAQFFPDLRDFVVHAVDVCKKSVLVVGLDGDADRRPFGQLLDCIPLADSVTKLKSFCGICGDGTEAIFTHRHANFRSHKGCLDPAEAGPSHRHANSSQTQVGTAGDNILVGGAETYVPLCRKHYLEAVVGY